MTAIALCVVSFALCYWMARRSLVQGLCATLSVGYVYGLVRANLPGGLSHLIFDCAVLGLYAAQLRLAQPHWQRLRSRELTTWVVVLVGWPALLFFVPRQDMLIQLVGLRGTVFLLPFLLLGARLTSEDLYKLGLWFSVLNLVAGAIAITEFFVGVDRFFPRNAVTEVIYRSKDLANYTAYRIPATFGSAHAYAGTMVMTIVVIAGAWAQRHFGRWQGRLMAAAVVISTVGIFMSATRQHALLLFVLIISALFVIRVPGGQRVRWIVVALIVGYIVAGDPRLQRFRTLEDPEFLSERLAGSVNLDFLQLVNEYPLGNGLGGGGTSVPYFLQDRVHNLVVMENEYARILLELGVPGLVMWVLFIAWVFTRPHVRRTDMFYLARRLAWIACAASFAFGFIGVGLFTSIPQTAIVFMLLGWIAVPEVRRAPAPNVAITATARLAAVPAYARPV